MNKRLSDIINDVEEFRKNSNPVQEIAEPIQSLVNLVNDGKISSFTLDVMKDQDFNGGYTSRLSVRVRDNALDVILLGFGKTTREHVFSNEVNARKKDLTEDTKNTLIDIGNRLSGVNDYLKYEIPVDNSQKVGSTYSYFYSENRRDLKENWTEEEAKNWPMLPQFLENEVVLKPAMTLKKKI